MQIACPQCQANYNVDEGRIPPQGVQIKCPRCQNTFVVQSPGKAGAVPLPGGGGAVPLPGAGAGIPLPGSGAKGAVPLPGGGAKPVPLPGGGGAVPLPGGGGAVPLPGQGKGAGAVPLPGQSGAVPLPGQGGRPGSLPSMEDIFGSGGGAAPAPHSSPADLPGRAMGIGDIFGDDQGGPSGDSQPAAHPFHGSSAVVDANSAGGDVLDFINSAGKPTAAPREDSFQIRKRSGRVLGPLSTTQVLTMFHKGELLGSEEASTDGVTWRPLAQIPAFAQTIQQAMANALSGLDDLPVPKGSGFDNLPAPKGGVGAMFDDLPVPRDGSADLPVPKGKGGPGGFTSDPSIGVDTSQLRDAEKAKLSVARQRQRRERSVFRFITAFIGIALVAAAGIGVNFIKPAWGYFGYKLVFKPKEAAAVVGKKTIEEAPPPPVALPAVDADYEELASKDTYTAYRLGAEQAARAVEAGKPVNPFPESAKKAAAQHVRFLSYLVMVDDLPAFLPKLRESLALADGDEVSKSVGAAGSSFADKEWDKGLAVLKPLADNGHVLPPVRKAEVWTWMGIGIHGKGDLDGASAAFDNALQANSKNKLALYMQALTLSEAGQPDAAKEYVQKVLDLAPDHPRANILLGKLLAAHSETQEQGKKMLVDFSEGKRGDDASGPERAQAYIARAYIATSAQAYPEALRYVQAAVDAVPLNRHVRIQAAEMALQVRDYKIAQANGEKLLEMNPDDVDGLIIVSRARIGNRDALGAYSDLQVAVKKKPQDPSLNYWFGVAAREMSKLEEARKMFENAAKLDPKRADPVVEIVYDLIEQGKLTEAVKRAGDAEDKVNAGERYKVKAAKAYAYSRRRQFEQAKKEYTEALDANPRDSDARARYATMLVSQRHLDEADKEINEATVMDAKNPAVIVVAGDALAARGDNKGALQRYENAMQLAPNYYLPYLHAARVAVNLKDQGRAKGFVDTAGQLRPGVSEVLEMQAIVAKSSDPKQASRTMQQAIDAAPEIPEYTYELGVIFAGMGAPVEAIDAFKKAVGLDPDYVDAYFALSKVQRDLQRPKDAMESLQNCVRIDPKRADAWVEIADLLSQQGDDTGSLRAYEKALKADPKNAESVCAMGMTLVQRVGNDIKNLKRGIDVLERCVQLNPKHPEAWKALGDAYKGLQPAKKRDAIRCYQKHLELFPDDTEASTVRDEIRDLGGR
jgi:predicted Zn finger-like uncharacterized protein